MIRKTTITNWIFLIALCYLIWPWFFEKTLLFNELLSGIGLLLLIYKSFQVGRDTISMCIAGLLLLGGAHAITSLFRMDGLYFYLRNTVIVYSMFAFFIGFYLLPYLSQFLQLARPYLQVLIGALMFIPLSRIYFERFGVATVFPALFSMSRYRWLPAALIVMNLGYALAHDSMTGIILTFFYLFIFTCPGYRFFKQSVLVGLGLFTLLFIYLVPYLALISNQYSFYSYNGIFEVMASHPILSVDGNSTWRLVLWKQMIVDNFPGNLLGAGFGTPVLKYYPIEDIAKLDTLPYLLGAHNSFVYLFGRLGIFYVVLTAVMYAKIFREYFYYKAYYYKTDQILIFWSFFAITIIASFNPALESPIYASGYWLILGLLARAISQRQLKPVTVENTVHT